MVLFLYLLFLHPQPLLGFQQIFQPYLQISNRRNLLFDKPPERPKIILNLHTDKAPPFKQFLLFGENHRI